MLALAQVLAALVPMLLAALLRLALMVLLALAQALMVLLPLLAQALALRVLMALAMAQALAQALIALVLLLVLRLPVHKYTLTLRGEIVAAAFSWASRMVSSREGSVGRPISYTGPGGRGRRPSTRRPRQSWPRGPRCRRGR